MLSIAGEKAENGYEQEGANVLGKSERIAAVADEKNRQEQNDSTRTEGAGRKYSSVTAHSVQSTGYWAQQTAPAHI